MLLLTGLDPESGRIYYTDLPTVATALAPEMPPSPPGPVAWGDVTDKPSFFDGVYDSLTGKPALFSGSYLDLTNKPTLFDGAYASLSGKPVLGTAAATAATDYATAAQGAKADTALQNAAAFATAAQGVKADSAVQPAGLTKAAVGLANADNTSDAAKPVSTATQTALDAKAPLASPSFTTPNIGVATGTSLAVMGALRSSGTAGIGYAAGAGGTVTQATNKTTGVTLNKICGQITMNGAALAAAAEVSFVVTNSTVASTDVVVACVQSVGTAGAYFVTVGAVSNGSFALTVGNASAGSLSQAVVLNFVVLKGVAA